MTREQVPKQAGLARLIKVGLVDQDGGLQGDEHLQIVKEAAGLGRSLPWADSETTTTSLSTPTGLYMSSQEECSLTRLVEVGVGDQDEGLASAGHQGGDSSKNLSWVDTKLEQQPQASPRQALRRNPPKKNAASPGSLK